MKTSFGDMDISVRRDRKGDLITSLSKSSGRSFQATLKRRSKGMTTADIESHIREIYGIDVSDSTISRVTDKILPVVKECAKLEAGEHICDSIYGCYPLSYTQRRPDY